MRLLTIILIENEIYFDLYDTPHLTISEERMEAGFAHLQFEDVLQYVALPRLHVEKLPVQTKFSNSKKPQQPDGRGRKDMEFIFEFLRDKKVSRVIRVIVDDTSEPSHSDESIEICLGGLNVEIWDWMKVDLCTETIYTAAPDVRELSLYWSGNNSVLRGWSEREGLAILTKLELVHLHVQQVRLLPSNHIQMKSNNRAGTGNTNPYSQKHPRVHQKTQTLLSRRHSRCRQGTPSNQT